MTTFIEKGVVERKADSSAFINDNHLEPGDASDDDDDIEVGGVTQDYKCPLTLTPLEDPLTSYAARFTIDDSPDLNHSTNSRKTCKHSFSGAAIREYLAHGMRKCPATGCNKKITMADLKADKGLERRARDHARREAMRAEEDEVDAEIID